MFSEKVRNYLKDKGDVFVKNFSDTKKYKVRLGTNEVELLDRKGLMPVPLAAFDSVERCLDNGINILGCDRLKLGDAKLDAGTIMYHVGRDAYGLNDGDSMISHSCYIFAILEAAGCINRSRGRIDKR